MLSQHNPWPMARKDELNFIRPHMALNGKALSEASGKNSSLGENRWKSFIRRSTQAPESCHVLSETLFALEAVSPFWAKS